MKVPKLIFAIIAIALMACSKNEIEENALQSKNESSTTFAELLPDEHNVNGYELSNVVKEFCGDQNLLSRASDYDNFDGKMVVDITPSNK